MSIVIAKEKLHIGNSQIQKNALLWTFEKWIDLMCFIWKMHQDPQKNLNAKWINVTLPTVLIYMNRDSIIWKNFSFAFFSLRGGYIIFNYILPKQRTKKLPQNLNDYLVKRENYPINFYQPKAES